MPHGISVLRLIARQFIAFDARLEHGFAAIRPAGRLDIIDFAVVNGRTLIRTIRWAVYGAGAWADVDGGRA